MPTAVVHPTTYSSDTVNTSSLFVMVAGHGFGVHQNGASNCGLFAVWYPKMAGLIGSVPYGVFGSVSALAMGAKAIAPPNATTANHGARYLIAVVMIVSCLLVRAIWATSILSGRKVGVVDADTHLTLVLAAILLATQITGPTCGMENILTERFKPPK
jgi:hypothetical protein